MMIKEIRRELKRQLQEMMHFKFNLFFSLFSLLASFAAHPVITNAPAARTISNFLFISMFSFINKIILSIDYSFFFVTIIPHFL